MTAIHLTAAAAAVALTSTACSAFAPTSQLRTTPTSSRHTITTLHNNAEQVIEDDLLTALSSNPTLNLLPPGSGFSASVERVLSDTSSKGSYYKAHVDESVIDVMEGITADLNADVALVFEGEELRGLFTDSDYIKVCVLWCCHAIYAMGLVVV